MKNPKTLVYLGIAALLSACAIQPYHAEIDTFDGLIKINPKDVRECEDYAKSNSQPEYTLQRDLAYGALSGFLFGGLASTDRTAALLIGTMTGSNVAVRSIENNTQTYDKECLKARGYIVTN
jgi:hypothetical protein